MSLSSMTGYARVEKSLGDKNCTCEIKSLNGRFLDVSIKAPRILAALEPGFHTRLKRHLSRGKLDVFFTCRTGGLEASLPTLSRENLLHYGRLGIEIETTLNHAQLPAAKRSLTIYEYMKLEGVLGGSAGEANPDDWQELAEQSLNAATEQLLAARLAEGANLAVVLLDLLTQIEAVRRKLQAIAPQIKKQMYANLEKRLDSFMISISSSTAKGLDGVEKPRLYQEIAILADKYDVEEELKRLASHLQIFRQLVKEGTGVGKKLDFLCQEMHREANTLGNKLINESSTELLLRLKELVEQLRQQVQNIE